MTPTRLQWLSDAESLPWNSSHPIAFIWPLLGRHIAFHRRLVDLTTSAKAALLLSQTVYWTRRAGTIEHKDGWLVKTTQQWEMETALSATEQATSRERLRQIGILEEKRMGIPAKLHFRLSVDQLAKLLCEASGRAFTPLDWSDGAICIALLGPSIAYHRTLATIGGGANAGLLLSRALYLTRLQIQRRLDAWLPGSASHWAMDVGLTRREQEKARRALRSAGLWQEALRGIPATRIGRVCLEALAARLTEIEAPANPRGTPVCGVPTSRIAQNGETSLRQSHILVSTKAPNKFPGKRHHCLDESAKLHIQGSTGVSVQPPPAVTHASGNPEVVRGGGDLIFPENLLPEERAAAATLLRACPDQAQAVLDELEARLRAKTIRSGPIAYLRGLVRRAAAGGFVPELGQRIAAERKRARDEAIQRAECEAQEQRLAAERVTPEYQARVAQRRSELRKLLDAMQDRPTRKTRHDVGGRERPPSNIDGGSQLSSAKCPRSTDSPAHNMHDQGASDVRN